MTTDDWPTAIFVAVCILLFLAAWHADREHARLLHEIYGVKPPQKSKPALLSAEEIIRRAEKRRKEDPEHRT